MPASNAPKSAISPVETLNEGQWLDVGEGHRVWWCEGGDPAGAPVLVIHGGPGGRTRAESVEGFHGRPIRWICMDQRGCGRSLPLGETRHNTVALLVADIEALRLHLGVSRWGVAAGSWGAFVALAWAAQHPQALGALFLRSPFLGSQGELAHYLAPWQPWLGEAGRALLGSAPGLEQVYQPRGVSLSPGGTAFSPACADTEAGRWDHLAPWAGAFDEAQSVPGGVVVSGAVVRTASLPEGGSESALAAWRIHAHYASTGWTCGQDAWAWALQVLPALTGPLTLVHGEADAVCPVATTHRLAAMKAEAEVVAVARGGHRMGQEPMRSALCDASGQWAEHWAPVEKGRG